MVVKIAARQSDLARLQAFEVGHALEAAFAASNPNEKIQIEYAFRSSLGDQRADDPLWKMPEKGVFTEDFVADILAGKVDMVVHSWKDLPIMDREGTKIVATLPRADARDVLLVRRDRWAAFWGHQATRVGDRPSAFKILTSSPRRVYNLEPFLKWALPFKATPAIEFVPVRGNIATRVGKLVTPSFDDSFDGLVVAKAALDRLLTSGKYGVPFIESAASLRQALSSVNFVVLPLSVNPAAAAQGALAIEVRNDRKDLIELCSKIDATQDRYNVEAERRELARHGGGCHQKIGVTVLRRDYGTIEFVRGLTDAGLVLDVMALKGKALPWPKPQNANEVFHGEFSNGERTLNHRSRISHLPISKVALRDPSMVRGYFVARAEGWPEEPANIGDVSKAFVWTAGLATWKKLSERGVWVHGSAEGLGEDDDTRLEILAGHDVDWLRLTHEGAIETERARAQATATYKVEIEVPSPELLKKARFFYWRSGSQFRAAFAVCPEIVDGYHATGPGHTHAAVRAGLKQAGVSEGDLQNRLAVFLNEKEFIASVTV